MARTDPAQWVTENAAFQERATQYNALLQHSQAIQQQQTAEQDRQHAEYRAEQRTLLQEKLPQWRDAKVQAADVAIISTYAQRIGYSPQDLEELFDHRALLILRDAALADHQKAARATAKDKQVKNEPPKVIKPGAPKPTAQTRQKADELLARAKRTHGTDDAIAFLLARQKG